GSRVAQPASVIRAPAESRPTNPSSTTTVVGPRSSRPSNTRTLVNAIFSLRSAPAPPYEFDISSPSATSNCRLPRVSANLERLGSSHVVVGLPGPRQPLRRGAQLKNGFLGVRPDRASVAGTCGSRDGGRRPRH